MLKKLSISLAGVGVAVLAITGSSAPVAAQLEEGDTPTSRREEAQKKAEAAKEAAKARIQGRLDEAKKKICANRSAAIQRIMQNAANMGQRHYETFGKIATRVQEFYTNKKLSVSNYDQLVADINSKQQAANAAIQAVKNSPAIDCNGENPVGAADQFKTKVAAMHKALKDYRVAIHNLLVAVKTAAGKAEGGAQ